MQRTNCPSKVVSFKLLGPSLNSPSNHFQIIGEDGRLTEFRTFLKISENNRQDSFLQGLSSRIFLDSRLRKKMKMTC
jgi:hypothetical protein